MIDLYLVGTGSKQVEKEIVENMHCNILYSYYSSKKEVDKKGPKIKAAGGKVFVDSGAFTAWTKGVKINTDKYIEWLNNRDFIDLCGQLDVIPGDKVLGATIEQVREAAKATWENYLYMYDRLKHPEKLLYTFHVGEPIEFLKQALDWRDKNGKPIQYMALGGMVGKPTEIRKNFLDSCFNLIESSSNPNIKVHTFGMTSISLLKQYPITSADSTSWIMTGAMGNIISELGTIAISSHHKNEPNYYLHLPKEARDNFSKTIEELGFTLEGLAEDSNQRVLFNAKYMKKEIEKIEYKGRVKKEKLF